VPARILHVSDLHVGTREEPAIERALTGLVERIAPELLIASGDLTHRGRRTQHERAAALLRSFGIPVLAVPGNHDIPIHLPARFSRPFAEFERAWGDLEPTYASPQMHAVGLNSVRPWRHQSGGLGRKRLESGCARLAAAAPGSLRIAVLHHQLLGSPWRSRKRPVARRHHVLRTLVDAGAELILAGHIHQAALSERHEFEVVGGGVRGAVVSTAPGLGQPRPRRLGEARGLHVYHATERTLTAHTYIWRDDDWGLTAVRTFARGLEPLATEAGASERQAR
jgi:3',5'-cyclic AMP phosphodiesterase CpdA